jgi:hypothetical protein
MDAPELWPCGRASVIVKISTDCTGRSQLMGG